MKCYRRLVETRDVFYVQKVLLDAAGEMKETTGPGGFQMSVNVRAIIRASKYAKSYVKSQCGFKIDFDDVERKERFQRPKDHVYNLVLLAHEQGLLQASDDSDGEDC